GLVDEHHAAIEIAFVPSQAFVNLVGDNMRDSAPVFGRGEILLPDELLTSGNIPKPEFSFEPPVALPGQAAGDEGLRVDGFPALELRSSVDVNDLFDEGGL